MKETKLNIDLSTLQKRLESVESDKNKLGLELLEEAMFLKSVCIDLRNDIKNKAVIQEMQQGSYSIERVNPSIRAYNQTYKNFESCIKQLLKVVDTAELEEWDDFDNF